MNELYLLQARDRRGPGLLGHARRRAAVDREGNRSGCARSPAACARSISSSTGSSPARLPRAKETAEIVAVALGIEDRLETSNVLETGSDAGEHRALAARASRRPADARRP